MTMILLLLVVVAAGDFTGKLLKKLHKACQQEDGTDDPKKGSQLLEVYAIEIQMYTEQKDTKRLKQLYERSLKIQSAIAHPKIMGNRMIKP